MRLGRFGARCAAWLFAFRHGLWRLRPTKVFATAGLCRACFTSSACANVCVCVRRYLTLAIASWSAGFSAQSSRRRDTKRTDRGDDDDDGDDGDDGRRSGRVCKRVKVAPVERTRPAKAKARARPDQAIPALPRSDKDDCVACPSARAPSLAFWQVSAGYFDDTNQPMAHGPPPGLPSLFPFPPPPPPPPPLARLASPQSSRSHSARATGFMAARARRMSLRLPRLRPRLADGYCDVRMCGRADVAQSSGRSFYYSDSSSAHGDMQ